ncbi:MAG: hypothetical protein AAGA21_16710, partial [Pseudomonadota bacterium]
DTVDLTALQWLNRKEPRASEKNRHHHRSVKKSETSKRFVTTKIESRHSQMKRLSSNGCTGKEVPDPKVHPVAAPPR